MSYGEKDEAGGLGAVLTAVPDEVAVTIQLRIDVLEPLRQKTLCESHDIALNTPSLRIQSTNQTRSDTKNIQSTIDVILIQILRPILTS